VILPKNYKNKLLDDSKKLNEKKRMFLREEIMKDALHFAIAEVDNVEVDEINILNASFLAMHRAVDQLTQKPELLLIDGNRFKAYQNIPHQCIIKGDGKYLSIAAASILAKTSRDLYMEHLHQEFPAYNWIQNKGYPTKDHRAAIAQIGACKFHRRSFALLPEAKQLALF
jgi:ribonuclease HII